MSRGQNSLSYWLKTNFSVESAKDKVKNITSNVEVLKEEYSQQEEPIYIDILHSSITAIFDDSDKTIRQVKIKRNTKKDPSPGWYDFYYSGNDSRDEYIKIKKIIDEEENILYRNEGLYDIITFTEPISNPYSLKIVFLRDELDPIPYKINEFTEVPVNSEVEGYRVVKEEDSAHIYGKISEVVRIYAEIETVSGSYDYDSSDRRTSVNEGDPLSTNENSNVEFNDKKMRISKQGEITYIYDNFGRRVVKTSFEGTTIYRYNIEGRLNRVYQSPEDYSNRIDITEETLANFDNDLEYKNIGFSLTTSYIYNASGQRIYETIKIIKSIFIVLYQPSKEWLVKEK